MKIVVLPVFATFELTFCLTQVQIYPVLTNCCGYYSIAPDKAEQTPNARQADAGTVFDYIIDLNQEKHRGLARYSPTTVCSTCVKVSNGHIPLVPRCIFWIADRALENMPFDTSLLRLLRLARLLRLVPRQWGLRQELRSCPLKALPTAFKVKVEGVKSHVHYRLMFNEFSW